jgi:cytochrome c-type biogenesis protein
MVERTVGVLLVLTGIGFLTGAMQTASFWLLDTFPALATLG